MAGTYLVTWNSFSHATLATVLAHLQTNGVDKSRIVSFTFAESKWNVIYVTQ